MESPTQISINTTEKPVVRVSHGRVFERVRCFLHNLAPHFVGLAIAFLMVGVIITLVLFGRQRNRLPISSPPLETFYKQSEEKEIAAVVFEYMIQNNVGLTSNGTIYFLEIFDTDPEEELLRRFDGRSYIIRKHSQAIRQKNKFFDKETGQSGILLEVNSIKWLSSEKVKVEGAWVIGWNDLALHAYEVERKNRNWTVFKDEVTAEP